MFTNQSQAMAAIEQVLGADAAQALSFMFQCENDLLHLGKVELKYTSPEGANSTDAPLSLYNYAGGGDRVNGIPEVGTALYVGAGNIVLNGGGIVNIGPNNVGGVGVRVFNNSGEPIPAYGIMRIIGKVFLPIVTPTGVQLTLHVSVGKPDTTFRREYLVNGGSLIATGGTGVGFAPGICTALYGSGSPALGQEWGPTPSQWYLSANRPGFYIYDTVSTTALTLLANQERVDTIHGTLDGNITSGGAQDVSIYFGAAGAEADSTLNLSANSYIAATTISSGKIVKVTWINGVPYVTQARC